MSNDQTRSQGFPKGIIAVVVLFILNLPLHAVSPVKLILDTDMSGDADDAGTLAMLHALADLGECELLAIVTNRKDPTNASAAAVDAINTYYGRPNIPIGTDKAGPTALERASEYTTALRDNFPNDIGPDDSAPDALDIYREALKGQADQSVVICSVGAFSNLAALCRGDLELVRKKVRHLVVMGGQIPPKETPEVNIAAHVEAARYVAAHWAGKIFWQGFRVGHPVMTGDKLKQTPKNNPVRRAFELRHFGARFSINGGQPSYDQAVAYFAVRGSLPELWKEKKNGRVLIDEVGFCSYKEDPEGEHVLVTRSCPPARLAKLIEALMIAAPKEPDIGKRPVHRPPRKPIGVGARKGLSRHRISVREGQTEVWVVRDSRVPCPDGDGKWPVGAALFTLESQLS